MSAHGPAALKAQRKKISDPSQNPRAFFPKSTSFTQLHLFSDIQVPPIPDAGSSVLELIILCVALTAIAFRTPVEEIPRVGPPEIIINLCGG